MTENTQAWSTTPWDVPSDASQVVNSFDEKARNQVYLCRKRCEEDESCLVKCVQEESETHDSCHDLEIIKSLHQDLRTGMTVKTFSCMQTHIRAELARSEILKACEELDCRENSRCGIKGVEDDKEAEFENKEDSEFQPDYCQKDKDEQPHSFNFMFNGKSVSIQTSADTEANIKEIECQKRLSHQVDHFQTSMANFTNYLSGCKKTTPTEPIKPQTPEKISSPAFPVKPVSPPMVEMTLKNAVVEIDEIKTELTKFWKTCLNKAKKVIKSNQKWIQTPVGTLKKIISKSGKVSKMGSDKKAVQSMQKCVRDTLKQDKFRNEKEFQRFGEFFVSLK